MTNKLLFSLFLPITLGLLSSTKMATAQNSTSPVNVGVVLDMDTWLGKMGLSCITMALSDFYASHINYKTRLVLNTRDSKRDVVGAAAAALDLIKNVQVRAILGPSSSMQADFMIDLGDKAQVPIISFSATSPFLSWIQSPYFIRATQNDSSQVKAISAIVQAFGWREVVPIYAGNEFGQGIIPFLTDALTNIDVRVPYRSIIPSSATDDQILAELYNLMTMQTRIFIVHLWSTLGSRLFAKAKEVGMMDQGYVWIITDSLTDILNELDPSAIDSMQGVIGVKPYIPQTKQRADFTIRWKKKFQRDNPNVLNAELNVFGLWAYDAATALAISVEKAGISDLGFQNSNVSKNSTDLETFGVSPSGPDLLNTLNSITFKGLSGDFHTVNGQLQPSAYQIVNVLGNGGRGIGFWTEEHGIVKRLNLTDTSTYSTSKTNLKSIIWPGDTTSPSKGWVIPTNGKRLRIGVPVKDGFSEFVMVTRDPSMSTTNVTGYCIDAFDAAMELLPYAVPYDYIPFDKTGATYNDLVYQVYLGNFDAAVGDITIRANRSIYADFTLPYTESGVLMIVPVKDNKEKNVWVFLRPLTWELWVTTFCSFVFIGFVVWFLEHRINEEFRGPPSHEVGLIFWFSFSTMVFAQKEKVVSNLARFVLIIWFFLVLILTQSYTASLASMLTVQKLQPVITDVNELLKNKDNVGYQEGSFVLGILKQLKFDETNLKVFNSPEELDELFIKGSKNGGIAAAFDEIPYIKVFLARHCSKYTTVEPTYKTDGFGFVFPIGSPLVTDVSRKVLKVTEGKTMTQIEKKWFGNQNVCPDPSTALSSNNLGLESFWGLFLSAGFAALSALVISVVTFIRKNRHVSRSIDPQASTWHKIVVLARHWNRKDMESHTFRNLPGQGDRDDADNRDRVGVMEVSPRGNAPEGPLGLPHNALPIANGTPPRSSFSNQTEENIHSSGCQGRPSRYDREPDRPGQTTRDISRVVELPILHHQTSDSTNQ
ncbi:hypothetical protein RJ640_021150 [Escallonia rubra]|uniref:Ionotropic glutamate receptor C-terminal domain-containing protein n=1 Tax=Escallonia rubra TaxID=112253 RepID=A0AA88UC33_9ASTE|nr:hypothetical protein RJ640_021150 [Escallonia rubra]